MALLKKKPISAPLPPLAEAQQKANDAFIIFTDAANSLEAANEILEQVAADAEAAIAYANADIAESNTQVARNNAVLANLTAIFDPEV